MKWFKVQTSDYYGEYEYAGPSESKPNGIFKHGDNILIKWPDKFNSVHCLIVVNAHGSAQVDMNGYPDEFPTRTFFIEERVFGKKIRIPLKGMMISLDLTLESI
jgi:hypothetical protein